MNNIVISPIFSTYMSGRIWMGLDVIKLKKFLLKINTNVNIQIIELEKISNDYSLLPLNSLFFYSVSYNKNYDQFIKDLIYDIALVRKDVKFLPDINQLFSFENKGYQELYKKRLSLKNLAGKYYGDIDDLINDNNKFNYPFVLKINEGALSSGVSLIKDESHLKVFRNKVKKKTFRETASFLLNKRNSFKKDIELKPNQKLLASNFDQFFQKRKPVITQTFISGLSHDFKVLVFGNKFFVLQRDVRDNDFRASGSGKFRWVEPPQEVLNYSLDVVRKMKVSFISLDVGIDENKNCFLFEYQGVGFGPLTLTNSDSYFIYTNNVWKRIVNSSDLEESYAYAINYYANNLNENN